jgi:hypothetical protein
MKRPVLKSPAQVLLEGQIKAELLAAGFTQKNKRIEAMLVAAILLVRQYLAKPVIDASQVDQSGRRKSGAKNKEALRFYLYSTLFAIWYMEFKVKPKINNKKNEATPFVKFAAPILKREKFGKFIDHAEKYQSYRAHAIEQIEVNAEEVE